MYEYSVIVRTLDMIPENLARATADDFHDSIALALTQTIDIVEKDLDKFQGGGWEMLSHDVNMSERFMVVSFLLRRPKK